jgi:tetratricopeptide (TPR) repeat protein
MYLDVTSYILTVLTFSVGFLSTRRHAHFDVLSKDLADRSWKIRQALNTGQDLGPRDLAEDIAAVAADPDSVSVFARIVNATFFASACVVVILGLMERQGSHVVTLLIILLISTALVFALGEFDVLWMNRREQDLASGTILGQLAEIDEALRSSNSSSARNQILRIREAYPNWGFGRELEIALAGIGDAPVLRDSVEVYENPMELLEAGSALYAAPILVAEAQLRQKSPIDALQDFHIVLPRSNMSRTFDRLRLVLGFAAGLPRVVFNDPELPPLWLSEQGGLELGLSSLPAVRRASEALRDFGSGMGLQQWMSEQEGTPAWLVASIAIAPDDSLDALLQQAMKPLFSGALNSIGIACLSRGRDGDALRIFETAIRVRPNSSTSHWGRAVSCQRRGWQVAANESLHRAESLDPSSERILNMTSAAFAGEADLSKMANQSGEPEWSVWEAIQMALLGCRVNDVHVAQGSRGELAAAIINSAIDHHEERP